MTHYTVGYLDSTKQHREICEYAEDAFQARNQAVQDVPWLHEHPNRVDSIINDGGMFSALT